MTDEGRTKRTLIGRRLWFVPLALTALAMLAGAAGPAHSAFPGNNGLIAFTSTRDGGSPELFLLDTTTLQATKVPEVAAGGGGAENPVWSPDGTEIAFSRSGAIEVYEVATGALQTIPADAAYQPAWSPDGNLLAFTRFDEGNRGIWRTDGSGGVVRLTTGEHQDPAWSPDGGSIAFTKRRHFSEAGFILADSVYAMNPDGTGQVRADHQVYCCSNTDPAWSPDGQKLALTEDSGGPQRIGVLEVDLNEGMSPVTDFEHDFAPAWSPDGTRIVFERVAPGGRALFAVTPGAPGGPTPLTGTPPAFDTAPDWQPLPTMPAAPTCSIGVTRVDESAVQASFVVHCRNPTTFTYTLDYASSDAPGHTGTAQPLIDYTPAAGSIAVPPGETRSPIHVAVVGDIVPEPHETIWVRISSNDFPIDNDAGQATATIIDDDGFQVSVETKTVVEGAGGSTDVPVRVRLSHPADQVVDVFVHAVTPAGARSGYHDVDFAPGEIEKVITYPVAGDSDVEGDERVEFAPVTWLVPDANLQSGFLTIADDDAPTTLSVGDVTVAEGAGSATVVVARTSAADAVAFDFAVESGTATEGDDFGSAGGRASFHHGDLTTTLPVPITDDALDEADETFSVRISNPAGATIVDDLGLVTITDNDDEPTLAIGDVSVAEGDTGTAAAQLSVTLSAPSGRTVRLRYATADGTATAPGDYTAVPPTELVIPPLATAVTAPVDVLGDTDPEGNETFRVGLSAVENATVVDDEATVTIVDDEPFASLSIADVVVAEGDAGPRAATFTVTRSHTAGAVSFRFLTEDGNATPLADYFPHGGTVTFAFGSPTATFTVEVAGDVLDEEDETFSVRLSSPANAVIADDFAFGTIVDDDAEPTLSIDDVSVQEGNAGTSVATFTVTLSAPSAKTVTVTAATADGTATAPGDYSTVAPTTLTFAGTPTQTFDVTVVGDAVLEANETFTVLVSGALNATVADGQGVGSILDDEAPSNDHFANASPLGAGDTAFDTSFASVELGEPGLAFPEAYPSVWYQLTPGQGGVALSLSSALAFTANRISVYTGSSLGALTLVAQADNSGGGFPGPSTGSGEVRLEFLSKAGQLYYIQVLGPNAFVLAGNGTLTTTLYAAPANDDFGDAALLPTGPTNFDTSFGSVEAGEPGLAQSGPPEAYPSVWYQLTPGRGGVALHLSSFFALTGKRISVYTGSSLSALTLVAQADNSGGGFPASPTSTPDVVLEFPSEAGQLYYVQVLGPSALEGPVGFFAPGIGLSTLTTTLYAAPANDDFGDAALLPTGQTTFDTSFGSVEAGEPGLAQSGPPEVYPSVWYRFNPGQGGVALHLSSFFALTGKRISVYTGSSLSALTLVAQADNSGGGFPAGPTSSGEVRLEFLSKAGQLYYVQVLGSSALEGPVGIFAPGIGSGALTTALYAAPANDDFGDAALLPTGQTNFDTSFASVEAGEPGLAQSGPPEVYPSVWYQLTAGQGGVALHLNATAALTTQRVSVYTGSSLGALTLVAQADNSGGGFPAGPTSSGEVRLEFLSKAGQLYYVQVLGSSALEGPVGFLAPGIGMSTLTTTLYAAPANDDHAAAAPLPTGQTALDTSFASVEAGEPGLAQSGPPEAYPSVWYQLTPGQGGVALHLSATAALTAQRVSVYTGSSLGALTLVAQADNSGGGFPASPTSTPDVVLEFPSEAGQLYYVQVLGPSALEGPVGFFAPGIGLSTLTTTLYAAPANDDHAAAAPLPTGQTALDTSFASVETGEPGLGATTPESHPSVWFRLSPGLGSVSLRAESGRPRQLSVYTGVGLGSLTLVARASTPSSFPGVPGDPTAPALDLDFAAVCGTTYYVQALGPWAFRGPAQPAFDPTAGQGTLTRGFTPTPLPPNDAFADASVLPLGRTSLSTDWWACMSAQPGEPAHGGAPAARSLWYRATVASGRVTVDSPGNRVAVYRDGANLTGLTRVVDGPAGQASFLTPGGTFLIAVDGTSGTTIDLSLTPGEVLTGTGASLTTDNPPVGATASDPIETTIVGTAGSRSIFETEGATAPSAWSFLGWKVEISAPPLTPPAFYTITFRIDGTLVPGTGTVLSRPALTVFKDGQPIPASCAAPRPDPCVSSQQTIASGIVGDQPDRVITVWTSRASEWTFGVSRTTRGSAAGVIRPASGGDAEFLAASNGTVVTGALTYARGGSRFNATTVHSFGLNATTAWFAGTGRDGRAFLAYVQDNGPGASDRFRLWIGGVEQTDPGGAVVAGNILVQP